MSKRGHVSSSTQMKDREHDARSVPVEVEDEPPSIRTEESYSQPNIDNADLTRPNESNDASSTLIVNAPDLSTYGLPRVEVAESFNAIQKWIGYVTEVREETFKARITTLVGEGRIQDVEIYAEEVDQDDRPLIKQGAAFYWSIGYLDRPSGRHRSSILRFRRLPVWTGTEMETVKDTIENFKGLFEDEH
ncbi:MAG: hypothetical protein HY683_05000 [Chloroflexi bacterium]|nr:hypothetical protein [Chloroflexota bacterium]